MPVIIISGMTGTGKTTLAKSIISRVPMPKYIWDIDGEYKEFYNGEYLPIKKFFALVKDNRNTVIGFEEAAIAFKHLQQDEDFFKLLVTNRKARRNNFIILNFHAARQVPKWILVYCDIWFMKKTTVDSIDSFSEYPVITESFKRCKASLNKYHTEEINLREL